LNDRKYANSLRDWSKFKHGNNAFADVRRGHFPGTKLARPSAAVAGEHEGGVPDPGRRVAARHLAARLLLQERQKGHFPRDEHPQPLPLALPRQNPPLHVQVSQYIFLLPQLTFEIGSFQENKILFK